MIWRHHGVQLSLGHYHGVPKGWSADILFGRHANLGGTYPISDFEIGKWAAPSFMTERYEWLRYRQTLYRIADGIRAKDAACAEMAIQYIELNYIGSYSGFIRARLARCLKHADLTKPQKRRLNTHFLKIIIERNYTGEFNEYRALWGRIIDKACIDAVTQHLLENEVHGIRKQSKHISWLPKLKAAFEQRTAELASSPSKASK
jgi:hypothetical protein